MSNTPPATPPVSLPKFLPGLILGVVTGSLATAFVTPIAQTWARLPANPISTGPRLQAQPSPDRTASILFIEESN